MKVILFRFDRNNPQYKHPTLTASSAPQIETVYLDTTYAGVKHNLPEQQDCVEFIANVIKMRKDLDATKHEGKTLFVIA